MRPNCTLRLETKLPVAAATATADDVDFNTSSCSNCSGTCWLLLSVDASVTGAHQWNSFTRHTHRSCCSLTVTDRNWTTSWHCNFCKLRHWTIPSPAVNSHHPSWSLCLQYCRQSLISSSSNSIVSSILNGSRALCVLWFDLAR